MKTQLNDVLPPVSEAIIMVCEKCGKKLSSDPETNPSRLLQSSLKDAIKAEYGKGKFRAVITSCMDICPKDEIAIAISRSNANGGEDEFFTVTGDTETLRDEILARARKS